MTTLYYISIEVAYRCDDKEINKCQKKVGDHFFHITIPRSTFLVSLLITCSKEMLQSFIQSLIF